MAESVYAGDLKSPSFGIEGSNPSGRIAFVIRLCYNNIMNNATTRSNTTLVLGNEDIEVIAKALMNYELSLEPETEEKIKHINIASQVREGMLEAQRGDHPKRWASIRTAPFTWGQA